MRAEAVADRLPTGITGFTQSPGSLPHVDPKWFKAACHHVARQAHGTMEAFEPAEIARSYYAAALRTRLDHVSVLCHTVYPWLAFVPAGEHGLARSRFLWPERLVRLFSQFGEFRTIEPAWLESHPDSRMLADLDPVEIEQIRYWRPVNVGEIVFNNWD